MERIILEHRIRRLIREAAAEIPMHVTLGGKQVPYDCEACYDDLIERLKDALFYRDACPRGSADRVHYNGLLGIYRSRIRRHPYHVKKS